MASVLTDSGDGYGYGDGCGYGYSYGDDYGYGYSYGYGSGFGDGSGFGYGDGSGYGDGHGYGHNGFAGDGYGDEYGDCINLGPISKYSVHLIRPFNVVKVGCQVMSLNGWEKEWEKVSKEHELAVNKDEVEKLIQKAIEAIGE